ncbi:MAG TPA: radical SAM family heme chaperone HemW [Vicinamibacterales bacterium]|jgi:oxygen-independent coproporphyrinogen-3 oxidase|nr:radical SAM family heme chaperone HemW [Vicinamibacterales bacterium]
MLGLYIHIPFCSAICNYCNFNRGLFDAGLKARYVEALIEEIRRSGDSCGYSVFDGNGPPADTIYFGGGTPSLLEPNEVARIIDCCRSVFTVAADAEMTLEANPETVTSERIAGFRDAGINRISFGVQSFRDEELRRLSRLHDAERARQAVAEARTAGLTNVSLDLMMWLPQQRLESWLESVDAAIELSPEHLSLYLLEVYPNAPLKDEMARAGWSLAPDDDAAEMYLTAMERLEAAGYEQYEISNVSRPGRQSRHNLKYWTDGEWVGFGCGAHSTRGHVRWKNVSSTTEYIDRVGRQEPTGTEVRRLTDRERLGDALFTGLRLNEGIDLGAIERRYGVDVWQRDRADLEPFVSAGYLVHDPGRLRLTRAGMLLAHEVMAVFV